MVTRASRQRGSMNKHTEASDLILLKRGMMGYEYGEMERQAVEWELSSAWGAVKGFTKGKAA